MPTVPRDHESKEEDETYIVENSDEEDIEYDDMVEEDDDESDTGMVLGDDEPTNQIQASTRPTRRATANVKSYKFVLSFVFDVFLQAKVCGGRCRNM